MPTTLRYALVPSLITTALFATAPLHAEGPAVELEGYYAVEPARLTALDARARAGRGINLLARVPDTRQQAIDDADPSAPPTGQDEATSPLIAHFKPTPTQTRR